MVFIKELTTFGVILAVFLQITVLLCEVPTPRYKRNSAFWVSNSFCTDFTSSFRGWMLPFAARAAAHPEAWPMAIAGAIERADWNGACSQETHRPVRTRPSTFFGTSER